MKPIKLSKLNKKLKKLNRKLASKNFKTLIVKALSKSSLNIYPAPRNLKKFLK